MRYCETDRSRIVEISGAPFQNADQNFEVSYFYTNQSVLDD